LTAGALAEPEGLATATAATAAVTVTVFTILELIYILPARRRRTIILIIDKD
jgi:uncharacterized membrane protein YtjA (UPF0391 family)